MLMCATKTKKVRTSLSCQFVVLEMAALSPTPREYVDRVVVVVCWPLTVPATCECISETDLLRQVYVLPH